MSANFDLEGLTKGVHLGESSPEEDAQRERGLIVGDDQAPTYERAAVDLTDEESAAIEALVLAIEEADDSFRIEEIRPPLERREGWNGKQLLAWDPGERKYVDVMRQLEDDADPDQDIPSFHTDNFFTPYGLDFVALMIANPISTSFSPEDPENPKDVIAAEEGENLVGWINKQTDILTIRKWAAYYFWNDGFASIYTRMRADKARFGSKNEPEIVLEMKETRPAGVRCVMCGGVAPVGVESCEGCGASLEGAFPMPAEMGLVPAVARMLEVPSAGVVKEAFGLIEVRRTPGAKLVRDCGYLILSEDIPKAQARALYPEKRDELGKRERGTNSESLETSARRGLVFGGNQRQDHLVTHKRVWLRTWQLEDIDSPEIRESLKEKFPDGQMHVFMGATRCESFNELMEEHWTFRFAYPGHGSGVVTCGSATWDLQQTANELLNLRVEGARQGIPGMLVNNDVLDPEAFAAGRIQPGLIYQAKTPGDGGSLKDAVVATPTANLPNAVGDLENELGTERAQQRSGIVPALWGGQAGGAGRTLGGYRLMRDQGLMRHGIPWKELEAIANESDLQAVRLYAKDGYDDVEVSRQDESGEWGKSVISIDSLQGEIRIESDDDAGFPMGPAERRAAWFEYAGNDGFAPLVMVPQNEGITSENLGIKDLKFPGQDAREAQRREIQVLLEAAPILDPMTGRLHSTVPVDVELEDHDAHLQAIDMWANSRAGSSAQKQNPAGWANVKAHYTETIQAKTAKAMLVQSLLAPPMPVAPMGPGVIPFPASPGPQRGAAVGPAIRRHNPMEAPAGPGEANAGVGPGRRP